MPALDLILLFNTQAGREAAVLLLLILILILGAPLNHAGRSEGTPSLGEVPSV